MMKKRFMPIVLASLLALVGCGGSAPSPYAANESMVKKASFAFFGEAASKYISVGEDVIDAGEDEETGEEVYYDGAEYYREDYDRVVGGNLNIYTSDMYLPMVGYRVPEESEVKEAPIIGEVADELKLTNYTQQFISAEGKQFIYHEGGYDYFYQAKEVSEEGITIVAENFLAVYGAKVERGEELLGVNILYIQFTVLYVAKADLISVFGVDFAKAMVNKGHFDEHDKIHFTMETIDSWYLSFEE